LFKINACMFFLLGVDVRLLFFHWCFLIHAIRRLLLSHSCIICVPELIFSSFGSFYLVSSDNVELNNQEKEERRLRANFGKQMLQDN
jgi:hypothetical protein